MAAHASRRASAAWRPGDAERLVGGTVFLLVVVGALALTLVWLVRRGAREKIDAFAPGEEHEFCGEARDGRHALYEQDIMVGRRLQPWLVCAHCRRGMPAPRASTRVR